ncbi:MAG TPA: helix-turn-helix domain-containing protein [Alphaproteobacteria bacterium]|nr:AraC family transcriptional regulator [Alphaproteobacteria bacterium]USO05214.1 MAG: AraC family transcriptional regulator [Rhodospirillales bacterium]HOO81017.1 helix-turn-helix domain-containing protein [Alphaproteobacteria bacterium]
MTWHYNTAAGILDYRTLEKPLIQTSRKYMSVTPLDDVTSWLKYRRVIAQPEQHDQSFSKMWFLFRITDFEKNKVYCRLGDKFIHVYSPSFFFIPAFMHAKWHFQPGIYEYEAYTSYADVHDELPARPIFFPYDRYQDIQSYSAVVNLLNGINGPEISLRRKQSYAAEKTKLFLDLYYTEDVGFDDIAKELKLPRSTMSRSFQKFYRITPIAYRNILRTWEAMRLIRNDISVTQAAMDAGFTSLTQYNQHFHHVFDAPPSSFS